MKIINLLILFLFVSTSVFSATKLYTPSSAKELDSVEISKCDSDILTLRRKHQLMQGTIDVLKRKLNETIVENTVLKSNLTSKQLPTNDELKQKIKEQELLIEKLKNENRELSLFKEKQKSETNINKQESIKLKAKLLQNDILIKKQENAITSLNQQFEQLSNNINTEKK